MIRQTIIIVMLFVTSITTIGCKAKKNTNTTTSTEKVILAGVERTYCYGKCPVFKFWIYEDGTVHYEGIANVDSIGVMEWKLSEEEIEEIKEYQRGVDYKSFKEDYSREGVQDLPAIITIYNGKRVKDIAGESPKENVRYQEFIESKIRKVTTP